MTALLWTVGALTALFLAGMALRAFGAARWALLMAARSSLLEPGGAGARAGLPSPARFDATELDGLPAPVLRYFRAVLRDGQAIIASASLEMTGTINLSTTAEQWKPFASHQRVVTRRPGFLWNARVSMFPGVPANVEDSYIAGQGRLLARLLGLFTVADSQGDGEIARGEFMRYFAEAPWYPTALLPSQGVRWAWVDEDSAMATMVDGPIRLSLLFRFDAEGLIASVRAESRGAGLGKDGALVMLPWDCGFSGYETHDGMLVPTCGEAAWMQPAGRKPYFVGTVRTFAYQYVP